MYFIAYIVKTGQTQVGRAATAAEALEKIRLYRAARISQFEVRDDRGRVVTLDELKTLADIGH